MERGAALSESTQQIAISYSVIHQRIIAGDLGDTVA
jgi:hypothetical protein